MMHKTTKTSRKAFPSKTVILASAGAAILVAVGLWGVRSTGGAERPAPPAGHVEAEAAAAEIWTCAMHPQIRQPGPGKCPICAMDLVPVSEKTAETGSRELRLSPTARKLAEIQTAPVERRSVAFDLRMAGKIEYDETRVSNITAWVPGRLDHMYVDYTGVAVKAGDPMVSVYSPRLVGAQEELIQAAEAVRDLRPDAPDGLRETSLETLGAVRDKLRLMGLTPDQIGEIERRGTVSDEVVIRSPASGIVVKKSALEGQYVTTGTSIYTIADLGRVWVKLDAYESDLAWIAPGQEVEFSTEAYPGRTFSGEVAFIDPVLDAGTRTAKVRVNVDNPDGRLKPEMFVHGTVRVAADPGDGGAERLVIPDSAPLITGKRAVVYVETEPGLYTGTEITLGPRAGDFYVVEAGLQEGQRVVTNGNFKIDSALQILARPSMMNPETTAPAGMAVDKGRHTFDAPPAIRDEIARLYASYLEIHHGLSRDSLEEAQAGAGALEAGAGSAGTGIHDQTARKVWVEDLDRLRTLAGEIKTAGDISEARTAFAPLSETMYASITGFGAEISRPAYRFHCSMAFEGKGAFWLQDTGEVENPYWGAAMFRCGDLSDTLGARPAEAAGDTGHE
jgi:Cu(I)/Ag(I) efflux system membrane fusion protein